MTVQWLFQAAKLHLQRVQGLLLLSQQCAHCHGLVFFHGYVLPSNICQNATIIGINVLKSDVFNMQ